jgi:DNA-binding CsgD family transcriptional regulator
MAGDDEIDIHELRERVEQLTRRELGVWRRLADDLTYREIGLQLRIKERTVHSHASEVYAKLKVPGRLAAAKLYWEWDRRLG